MKTILTQKLIKKSSKKLSKYVAAFDYIDKVLIVISARSSGVYIIFSVSVVGAPIRIAGASFTLMFSVTTRIIKKLLSMTRYKKICMIRFLCWLKVN